MERDFVGLCLCKNVYFAPVVKEDRETPCLWAVNEGGRGNSKVPEKRVQRRVCSEGDIMGGLVVVSSSL